MQQTLLKCDRCSFITTLYSWTESCGLYALPDGKQVRVPVRAEWCYQCKTLRATENLPEVACTKQRVQEADRVLRRCVARYFLLCLRYGSRMASKGKALARDRLEQAQAMHRIVSNRKSPPRCLSCGSTDHEELRLFAFPEGRRTTLPIQHPGCGGHFVIDDRVGLCAENQGPIRYFTPEGDFLRSELEIPRETAFEEAPQAVVSEQSRFSCGQGPAP